jgi:hypothetical protein
MRSYKLGGLKHPSHRPMHICPGVQSKCCTLNDEIQIYQLWHGYAKFHTKKYVDTIVQAWNKLLEYHEKMKSLDRDDITVHYMSWRWIPYVFRMCNLKHLNTKANISHKLNFDSPAKINNELPGIGSVKKFDFRYIPGYLDNITKQAHMRKNTMIYKALLNIFFLRNEKEFRKMKKEFLKSALVVRMEELKLHHYKLMKAYAKRKRKKFFLHIFKPSEMGWLIKADAALKLTSVFTAQKKKMLKNQQKMNKDIKKMKIITDFLTTEGMIESMYNYSLIVDPKKFKKFLYEFVFRYRHLHRDRKEETWNKFKPSMAKATLIGLPNCPKYVLRNYRKIYLKVKKKEYMHRFINQASIRKKAEIKRMKLLKRWQKQH